MANHLFIIFSIFLIFISLAVVLINRAIYSLLLLVFTFILAAFLLLLLECEFLVLIFIMLYIGVIPVFFLFSIMMMEPKLTHLSKNKLKYFPMGSVFAFALLIPISSTLPNFFSKTDLITKSFYLNTYQNWYDLIDSTHYIAVYNQVLYFVLPFLVAGLILLLIIIGVVCLTNSFEKKTLQQAAFKQLLIKI